MSSLCIMVESAALASAVWLDRQSVADCCFCCCLGDEDIMVGVGVGVDVDKKQYLDYDFYECIGIARGLLLDGHPR